MTNRTREEWKEFLPKDIFVNNHKTKTYIQNVKRLLPDDMNLDNVIFLSICNDLWKSPLGYILTNGNITAIGCCHCLSNDHPGTEEKYVSGIKIPVTLKNEFQSFTCPFCMTTLHNEIKDNIKIDIYKEDLEKTIQKLRIKN